MSLDEKLAKIRSPSLQSQQHTAVVLSSVEDTLREQNTKSTPTAYFAALLALLKQSKPTIEQNPDNGVVTSAVYLLNLVTSDVPPPLLKAQFNTVVNILAPFLVSSNSNAPLLRSAIGCLESILLAQDSAAWNFSQTQLSPRQAVQALLSFAVDSRPKIRKRAREAIIKVLQNPPPGPAIDHPAAELCAVAAQSELSNAVEIVYQNRRRKVDSESTNDPSVIFALQLCKTVATASGGWPSKNIESLIEMLLSISRSRNEHLVTSAFEVFEVVLESMKDEVSSSKLPRLLESLIELKPGRNDSQLLPPWIAVVSRGYGVAGELEPEDTFVKLPDLFDMVSTFLISPSQNIRVSASECLISFFANCIPNTVILEPSVYDEKVFETIADRVIGLLTVKYQIARKEVFSALSALFDALRWRGDPYLLPLVKSIGELRGAEGFQGKQEADDVLGTAIRNLGPKAVLRILPHNLVVQKKGQPGRAWILPLLRDHVSNTNLAHFKSDMIPLSEAMYQRILDHGTEEKTMDIKIFEAVVQQVWATFPGYCDLPLDLQVSMDQNFAELLSNLLYKQTELRVDLCRGLQNLVESNQALLNSDLPDQVLELERRTKIADARKNIQHLARFSSNLLAVLFNVYSQTLPQSRAHILQCINTYLSITPETELIDTFQRVAKMLESELPRADQASSKNDGPQRTNGKLPPTSHTLLDLVIALSVHLPRSTFGDLFALASSILMNKVIYSSDPQLVKKAYKLIPRLATSSTGVEALKARNRELQMLMLNTAETTPVPARRDRLLAINVITSFLAIEDLHFIPSILSEVVLACKESNEKARNAGFDLLIALANKISDPSNPPNTIIRNRKVPHMPSDSPDVLATIEEVFTMVSAGLAGVAPHMVAASITALSRLFFEFQQRLSDQTRVAIVDTVSTFIQSNNREIVRSVLGFLKVMVVILPPQVLEPRMVDIVPALMIWSKENKGRLRVKVKGIIDRCIRKFGGNKVESWVDADERKMVVNIRKQRERSKRKNKEIDYSDDEKAAEKKYDNEFDEAVYGSDDSDSDSQIEGASDDDETYPGLLRKAGQARQKQQYIREDDENFEPLDLLDPKSMASISSRKLETRKRASNKAKFDEDGKLVFNEQEQDVLMVDNNTPDRGGSAVNAYLDAVDGPDAVKRGQRGRLKIKSGMQTQRSDKKMKNQDHPNGDNMDLDDHDARRVAQKLGRRGSSGSAGPGSPRSSSFTARKKATNNPKFNRRGLGVEKSRSGGRDRESGQQQKFRGGNGVGKRNVRFGNRGGGRRR